MDRGKEWIAPTTRRHMENAEHKDEHGNTKGWHVTHMRTRDMREGTCKYIHIRTYMDSNAHIYETRNTNNAHQTHG